MRHFSLITILLFVQCIVRAQPLTPSEYALKHVTINDPHLGNISFYIDTFNIHKKAPIFLEINGSGGLPLCLYLKANDGSLIINTFQVLLSEKVMDKFHYVIIDKPGTPFCDSIEFNDSIKNLKMDYILESYKFSDLYNQLLSLNWRVGASKKVLRWMEENGYWDGGKMVGYGYSEGGQVVASLAVDEPKITHIISVVGAGLNQFYDKIELWRMEAIKGNITHQQAQDSINVLLLKIEDIFKNSKSTVKQYEGHSYKRWASFCSVSPFEELRKLNIPIYMIVASNDESSPIYGLDYVPLDFIRLGKRNLKYEVCIGCNHFLSNDDENVKQDNSKKYFDRIINWLEKN